MRPEYICLADNGEPEWDTFCMASEGQRIAQRIEQTTCLTCLEKARERVRARIQLLRKPEIG